MSPVSSGFESHPSLAPALAEDLTPYAVDVFYSKLLSGPGGKRPERNAVLEGWRLLESGLATPGTDELDLEAIQYNFNRALHPESGHKPDRETYKSARFGTILLPAFVSRKRQDGPLYPEDVEEVYRGSATYIRELMRPRRKAVDYEALTQAIAINDLRKSPKPTKIK